MSKTEQQIEIESKIEEQLDRLGWLATNESPCYYCVDFRPESPKGWVRVYDDWSSTEAPWEKILEVLEATGEDEEYGSCFVEFDDNPPTDSKDWPGELIKFEQIEEGTCNDQPNTLITIETNSGKKYACGPHGVFNCALSDAFQNDCLFDSREEALNSVEIECDE